MSTTSEHPHALECLMMIALFFQLLADVLYKRYREVDKRFALQTRGAVASAVAMQLDAIEAAVG